MRRTTAILGALLVGLLVAAVPVGYRSVVGTKYRNFRVVDPGVLYRSGQLSPAGLRSVAAQYGVRTVVSLRDARDDGRPAPDQTEADWCASHGVTHVVLSPKVWAAPAPGAAVPVEDNLRRFLAVMADPAARPVLVHCFAGIHRTGGYVGVYRMEFDGWSAAEAVAEMESMGTPRTTFDGEISGYLRGYARGKLR